MNEMIQKLISDIKTLRQHLSPLGEYSICREDGRPLGLGDIMELGELMKSIDDTLSIIDDLQKCEGI